MDNKSIIKYENLLLRIHDRFDSDDLIELNELFAYLVKKKRTDSAAAILRLVLFYQPEVPELWTKLGDIQALNSKPEESHAAHREAVRLIQSRLHFEANPFDYGAEVFKLPAIASSEAVYAG